MKEKLIDWIKLRVPREVLAKCDPQALEAILTSAGEFIDARRDELAMEAAIALQRRKLTMPVPPPQSDFMKELKNL